MSIINQLLKDLEQRRKKKQSADDKKMADLSVRHQHRGGFVNMRLIVLLVVVVIVLVLLYFWYNATPKINKTTAPSHFSKQAIVTPTEQPQHQSAEPESAVPTKYEGVQLQTAAQVESPVVKTNHDMTQVLIPTTGLVHYKLSQNIKDHTILIQLSNANLAGKMILPENPAVELMSTKKTSDGLDLTLQLHADVKLLSLRPNQAPMGLKLLFKHMPFKPKPTENTEKIVLPTKEELQQAQFSAALHQAAEGNIPEAVSMLNNLIAQAPDMRVARIALVKLLIQQDKIPNAMMIIDQGLVKSPAFVPYIAIKARLLLMQNKPQQALNELQQASPVLEKHPEYYATLAVVQQMLGNHLYAAQIYRQLIDFQANNGIWWLGLGTSLEASGRYNAALQAYKRAVTLGNLKPSLLAYVETQMNELED